MIQAKAILRDAERILLAKHQVSLDEATAPMLSDALGEAAMLAIGPEWTKTTRAFQKTRQAHYLSAEYLIGRMVYANFYNLGILDDVRALLSRKGVDMAVLEDIEDAALGNGGLGRLAACFLDSAASLDLPLTGYGLRYRYGLFKQVLEDGMQKEIPDDWTRFGDPWSVRREELAVVVPMATGAVPYDMPVIGYHTDTIGTLRLWQTESLHEFDFALFNDYKYAEACADKNRAEDITKCLYPNDWNIEGKRLRLKQQYVLSSASLQDILRQYEARHGKNYRMLPREHALQLNDTHPVLAIPELIRLLMARGVSFACAARYAREMFGYTNHTVMPEALEKWELTLVASVAPEIERILRRLERMCAREPGLHIIQNGQIAMADLAVYMSHAVSETAFRAGEDHAVPGVVRPLPGALPEQDQRHHPAPLAGSVQSGAVRASFQAHRGRFHQGRQPAFDAGCERSRADRGLQSRQARKEGRAGRVCRVARGRGAAHRLPLRRAGEASA